MHISSSHSGGCTSQAACHAITMSWPWQEKGSTRAGLGPGGGGGDKNDAQRGRHRRPAARTASSQTCTIMRRGGCAHQPPMAIRVFSLGFSPFRVCTCLYSSKSLYSIGLGDRSARSRPAACLSSHVRPAPSAAPPAVLVHQLVQDQMRHVTLPSGPLQPWPCHT